MVLILTLGLTTTIQAQTDVGNVDYNPPTQSFNEILSQHGSYRDLYQNGFVGSTSRTRVGDNGHLLLLNTTSDIDYFITTILNTNLPPQHYYNSTDDTRSFTIVLPPKLFTSETLTRFNTTTNVVLQTTTDLHIAGVLSYYPSPLYRSHTPAQSLLPMTGMNLDDKQPFKWIYPLDDDVGGVGGGGGDDDDGQQPQQQQHHHHSYIWNPNGSGLINKPLLYPFAITTVAIAIVHIVLVKIHVRQLAGLMLLGPFPNQIGYHIKNGFSSPSPLIHVI